MVAFLSGESHSFCLPAHGLGVTEAGQTHPVPQPASAPPAWTHLRLAPRAIRPRPAEHVHALDDAPAPGTLSKGSHQPPRGLLWPPCWPWGVPPGGWDVSVTGPLGCGWKGTRGLGRCAPAGTPLRAPPLSWLSPARRPPGSAHKGRHGHTFKIHFPNSVTGQEPGPPPSPRKRFPGSFWGV